MGGVCAALEAAREGEGDEGDEGSYHADLVQECGEVLGLLRGGSAGSADSAHLEL